MHLVVIVANNLYILDAPYVFPGQKVEVDVTDAAIGSGN